MTLDIAALKSKLNTLKRTGTDRNDSLWKPKEGKQVIRIVPWKENASNPFIELHFHYLGNKTHLSPITYGNRDPIAEFADAIRGDQDRDPKERYAEARPFMPKLRTYVPVIVRGEEDKGVRFYSFGKTVYEDILGFINDPDYGDIVDVKMGRDLTLEYIPKEKSDTNFAKTKVVAKPNQTPLSANAELVEKWTTEQPNIKEMYTEPTFNELKVVLEKYLDPDNTVITTNSDQKDVPESKTVETAAPKAGTSGNVAKALDEFDELFNDENN